MTMKEQEQQAPMVNREELTALLERVRAAAEYDDELEAAVWLAVIPEASRKNVMAQWPDEQPIWEYHDPERDLVGRNVVPGFMRSIDAALALTERVLAGWGSGILSWSRGFNYPVMRMERSYPTNLEVAEEGQTLPIAIIAATLSALIAQAETP